MATGNISSPGLGSNLDIKTLVGNLMALETRPLVALDTKEAALQSQISFLGGIKGALSGFQSAARSLETLVAKSNFRATATDANVLVPATSEAVGAGVYAVTVTDIAQSQRLATPGQASKTAAIGAGAATTLSFTFGTISGGTLDANGVYAGAAFAGSGATAVTVDIDSTSNTLEGIRDAINAAAIGVQASIVNDGSGTPYRLVLNGANTGLGKSMKIEVTGDSAISGLLSYDAAGTQNLSQLQAARNATLTVDGVPITSADNAVTGVIEGLTFVVKAAGSSTVTVGRDTTQISAAIAQLVKTYNDTSKAVGDATAKGAVLQGSTGTVSILTRLRSEIGSIRSGLGDYQSLSQLGISFQRDGTLTLDTAKLGTALSANYADASAFLKNFSGAVSSLTTSMLGENGSLKAQTDGLTRSIGGIAERRVVLSRRLEAVEQRYLAQFTALDTLIASMKQTSSFLEQQLANLPKINNDR